MCLFEKVKNAIKPSLCTGSRHNKGEHSQMLNLECLNFIQIEYNPCVTGFDYGTVHVLMRITEDWRIAFSPGLEEMYVAGRKEFIHLNLLRELWIPKIIW